MNKLKKILIIDDDHISSWLNETMLLRTGLVESVIKENNGKSAIEYLQQCSASSPEDKSVFPDLIFLDLDMPVVNGFDVLQTLQQSETLAWLISDRVIVLTTTINPKDKEKAGHYHVYDFLVKPMAEEKVKNVVGNFLSRAAEGTSHKQDDKRASGTMDAPKRSYV